MATLYSASAVAEQLNISRSRVLKLAETRGLGKRPSGHLAIWTFTASDIEAMRERPNGRPRTKGLPE